MYTLGHFVSRVERARLFERTLKCPGCHKVSRFFDGVCTSCGYDKPITARPPVACVICSKPATRIVKGTGFCTIHIDVATDWRKRYGQKVGEVRSREYQESAKVSDYRDLNRLNYRQTAFGKRKV